MAFHYFLYPFLLAILVNIKKKSDPSMSSDYFPKVSLLISAYNEEDVIERKILNSIELDYPANLLEIRVISDASLDKTDEIVEQFSKQHSNVFLHRMKFRGGKSEGLNHGVNMASGDVIVFSDANAMYDKQAIRELTRLFNNPEIGFVVGKALYFDENENTAVQNESLYWKYETYIKELESKYYSLCVGDGAIYAIRRELYYDLEADDIGDFVNPLIIVSKNFKGVFNKAAVCYENAAGDYRKEFYRKRRIVNRSWRAFRKHRKLFNYRKHWKFMFELFSHKLLRWFNWLLLLILLISNLVLAVNTSNMFYDLFFIGQIIFYFFAVVGGVGMILRSNLPAILYLPGFFGLMHYAAFRGIMDDLKGINYTTWEHVRES